MQVLADSNIPLVESLFSSLDSVSAFHTYSQRQPSPAQLADCDVLLVRSITAVNAELLAQAPRLRFVGTATIGTEHVDQMALQQRNIAFASAPGANADSVAEYVLSCVLALGGASIIDSQQHVAIIGAGHTGRASGRRLQALGLTVSYYDPPLLAQLQSAFCDSVKRQDLLAHDDWQQVLSADIISCHVPLTQSGQHPTYHLFDADALAQLAADTLFINASRGAVVDNTALRQRQQTPAALKLALDVWESEPHVDACLANRVAIATPHIAGHSVEGKAGGGLSLYKAFCRWQKRACDVNLADYLPASASRQWQWPEMPTAEQLQAAILSRYDVRDDHRWWQQQGTRALSFDQARRDYAARQRRQLACDRVLTRDAVVAERMQQLGFTVIAG
ncbi:4-phosphoerythronate dehydrogenase [Idiomarina xiamenensis]|uniref:Erythronate-4-phosphate dehydrogenase n=1 Tax=Idiomarina xiamenensis 10-D-4 TaxID=740709 RepID=K2JK55_9GAMM|nr:4-phosphoerythronate dehydrogenase [Idiomarina xiamenensis]EKE83841.1 erythronate-4-phosphate dehydrogenase [Idiomarina xiamenensis 10-D-4]